MMSARKLFAAVCIAFGSIFVLGGIVSGNSGFVLIVCAVGGYFLLKWIRQSPPAVSASPYLLDVQYAVGVLSNKKKFRDLIDVLKLYVRLNDKHGRSVRYVPTLMSLQPTVFGASAQLLAVDGQEVGDLVRVAGRLATALMVRAVAVSEPRPGVFQLDLRVLDPLEQPFVLEAVTPASEWALGLGLDETGRAKSIPIRNVSGVIVGGLPGSGKTAWLTQTLATFAPYDAVQMIIIDGKGGMDLDALRPRSFQFLNDDMDLDAIIGTLQGVKELVRERLQNLHYLFGTANFWNHGPTPEVPVVFVVVDECQTFLDARQLIGKDLKAKGAEIHSLVNFLVRKGRSAGVVTILSTQKPTADSLPTDIRDNSSVRVCFGVQSRYAAEAVLGDEWSSDSAASPLGAPVGIGVASVDSTFVRFRAPYVPESVVSEWVERCGVLCRDPAQLLHRRLAQLT